MAVFDSNIVMKVKLKNLKYPNAIKSGLEANRCIAALCTGTKSYNKKKHLFNINISFFAQNVTNSNVFISNDLASTGCLKIYPAFISQNKFTTCVVLSDKYIWNLYVMISTIADKGCSSNCMLLSEVCVLSVE